MNLYRSIAAAALALAMSPMAAHAQAACTAGGAVVQLTQAQISALFGGNLVCGRPGPNYQGNPADRWQEEHMPGLASAQKDLFDYKLGPGHPVDPRKKVGTWIVTESRVGGVITHTYGPGAAFTWRVFGPAVNVPGTSVYSFCPQEVPAEVVRAYVLTSNSGCAGNVPPASKAAPFVRR